MAESAKMQAIADEVEAALVGFNFPTFGVHASDNIASSVVVNFGLDAKADWPGKIYYNSRYAKMHISPPRSRYYDPTVEPKITAEVLTRGLTIPKFRKATGSPKSVINRVVQYAKLVSQMQHESMASFADQLEEASTPGIVQLKKGASEKQLYVQLKKVTADINKVDKEIGLLANKEMRSVRANSPLSDLARVGDQLRRMSNAVMGANESSHIGSFETMLVEELRPGSQFVVVDISVPGGKMIGDIIVGVKKADAKADKLRAKGNKVQVIDALWYAPARAKLKAAGLIGEASTGPFEAQVNAGFMQKVRTEGFRKPIETEQVAFTEAVGKFQMGRIVATPGALRALRSAGESFTGFLERHAKGDWGDTVGSDARLNDRAVKDGSRIMSSYTLGDGTKFWIITDADDGHGNRTVTTILLPSEY